MARYRRVCHLVGLLLLIFTTGPSNALKCSDKRTSPGRQIICYTRSNDVERLEDGICRCTTIVHQGHDLRSLNASGLRSLQNTAKEANPDLKVVISISDKHELLKNSATTRHEIAANVTEILKEVDGVELNMTAGNKDHLVSFIKDLKDGMSNKSLEKMIFLELPTKPENLAKQFELKELSKYVDFFTVATHYLKDSDETYRTFHPSRLMGLFDMLNTDSLVDLISGMGAPKHKILISVPTNAYKFTLKKAENNTPRSLTVEEQPLLLDRKNLCDTMSNGEWTVERDEDLTAPYAFKNNTWIAFEDEISLKIKGKYVILRDLAGLGLRDVENDFKTNCGISLTQSIYQAFMDMKRKSREVVLSSLEKDLKGTEITYSRHVRSSDFRIVRVVDTEGKIRAVRENTQTSFSCTRQGYFVHPKSCNRFYRCVKFNQDIDDYSVFEFDCPAGLAFDERTEVCVWPGSVSKGSACPGSSEIEPVPRSRFRCPSQPGFYADPQNCRWFFACYDLGGSEMVPYEFRCPFGLVFDENRLICEWPWKVPNCNNPEQNNNGYSSYTYGNNFESQGGYAPQEGIIGQNGYIRQPYIGQDNSYREDSYNRDNYNNDGIKSGYNTQIYNGTGGFGSEQNGQHYNGYSGTETGAKYDRNNYNVPVIPGANVGYDGISYYKGGGTATGVDYNQKDYNAGSTVRPTIGYNEQAYNPSGVPKAEVEYQGQNYNAGDGIGTGVNYDGKNYDVVKSGIGQDGPTYYPIGTSEAKVGYEGNNYNTGDNSGTGVNYGQSYIPVKVPQGGMGYGFNYNVGDSTDVGINYDKKNYNTDNTVKPVIGHDGPSYNPVNSPQGGVGYDYNHNIGDSNGIRVNYDGKNYNTNGVLKPASGYNGQSYIPVGVPEAGAGYQGHNYNTGDISGTGVNYDGQNYNTNGVLKPASGHSGQTYIPVGAPEGGAGYQGHNYNTGDISGTGVNYGGKNYNADGSVGSGIGYNPPTYNVFGNAGPQIQNGPTYNTNGYEGQHVHTVGPDGSVVDCDDHVPVPGINYEGQYFNPPGPGYNYGPNVGYPGVGYNNPVYINPGVVYGSDINTNGYNDQNFGNKDHGIGSTTKPDDCDNQSNTHTTGNDNKKGSTHFNNNGAKTTQFNSISSVTTVGINNLNKGTYVPTGFTDGSANFAGGSDSTTGYTAGNTNGYSKNTGTVFTAGTTNRYGGHVTTGYVPSTTGITAQNGLITNHYGKTDQFGRTNGIITVGNTQYANTAGPTVYNASYNIGSGFPTTTIIPFVTTQNTFNSVGSEGTTPINSMGLTSTENFGNEYTNQAEKSFTSPARTPTGFTSHRPTQNIQNFNTATNVYDYSKVNLDAVTPVITIIRDGQTENSHGINGATNFRGSTIATTNYATGFTNEIKNSPYVGPSIHSSNNGITKFHESTKQPGSTVPAVMPLNNALPEVELDNSGLFGVKIGTSTTPANSIQTVNYPSTIAQNTGYRTNEYYDNGGRGTIRYNNGLVANKVTGNDIQDYRTSSYTRIPNSFIISAGNGENEQSTIQKVNTGASQQFTTGTFTKEGFTKIGPTKTGITTAQVGGSGSYVIGNGPTRAKPNPQYIGEQAFAGNFGTSGSTTKFGTPPATGTTSFSNNELLKFDTISETPTEFAGYSYPRPAVELEVKGTSSRPDKTQTRYLSLTTPSPNIQSFNNENSVIIETNAQNNKDFSTTPNPIKYTSNSLERFRTTIQQMSTLPQTISTNKPEIVAEFESAISTTPTPTTLTIQKDVYQTNNLITKPDTYLDVAVSFDQGNDYVSTVQGSTGSSDYSDITSNFDQGNFGQKIAGQTIFTNINYQQPTTNAKVANQNSELIKSTQSGYNLYTQTGDDVITQTGHLRSNQPSGFISTVNLPSSTIKPPIDNTFKKPIIATEFSQNQFDQSSGAEIPRNSNSANIAPQRSNYRIFNNQFPVEFPQQRSANRILVNQASGDQGPTYHRPSNKIISNEAPENFASRDSNNRNLNKVSSVNFVPQVPPSRILTNQNTRDFGVRTPPNEIISNLAFENSYLGQNQGLTGHTRTLIGSNVVTSIGGTRLENGFLPQNRENLKIISEFNGINDKNFGAVRQSTTTAPEVTTYTGDFSKSSAFSNGRLNARNQNKKVIVKLSDLHPLILGKLSAECTCKADPFAVFRGPNRKTLPINSQNRGRVDLANYDESDIYVDVDNDKDYNNDIELIKNIPSNRLIKNSKQRTNDKESDGNIEIKSRGEPSSTYLPPTSTVSTYLPPAKPSNSYLPSTTNAPIAPVYRNNQASLNIKTQNHQPLLIRVEDNNNNNAVISTRRRSSKALFDESLRRAPNNIKDQDNSFNRPKPESSKGTNNLLQDNLECARPGLFRHPKFCNKFYACHWDNWKKRYTLHVFNCPVHLAFDSSAGACNYPSKGPACQDNKLLI